MRPVGAEEMVLVGVLVPAGWGPFGEVSEVGLMTFDENEYRIDSVSAREFSLENHLQRCVRLSALVQDHRLTQVRDFAVLGITHRGSSELGEFLGCDQEISRIREEVEMMEQDQETTRATNPVRRKVRHEAVPEQDVAITPEKRRQMIAESAYYRAERRGFHGGGTDQDWLEAESEIDRMLISRKDEA